MSLPSLEQSILRGKFPETGFAKMGDELSEEKLLPIYQQLDELALSMETQYDDPLACLDQDIADYLKKSIGIKLWEFEKENYPFLFKNLKNDAQKYKHLTKNAVRHNMISFHYVNGFYDDLMQRKKNYLIPEKVEMFLKILQDQTREVLNSIHPLIDAISQKVPCWTSLKIWQHNFGQDDQCLLPLHYDNTIFTLILHTSDSVEQSLRIYPNQKSGSLIEMVKANKPYPLSKADFPILIPGWGAKTHFGILPTPHYVEASRHAKSTRNSLVFCISEVK